MQVLTLYHIRQRQGIIETFAFTCRKLDSEHLQRDDVDKHDPDRAVEELLFVPDEGDGRDALVLELATVRISSLHFSVDVLLKLFHVEQLERFLELQKAVGKLQDVVADCVLLQGVLDVDVRLAESFDLQQQRILKYTYYIVLYTNTC